MTFFRRYPFFCTLLFLFFGACVTGLWFLSHLGGELSQLKAAFHTKASQYDRYVAARPSPTLSNLEAIEANYDNLYGIYEKSLAILKLNTLDRVSFFGETPVSRADWSFEIHRYKENARYSALSNSIELPIVSEFGFESFSGAPPADQMEEIHHQIVVMSSLLDTLFDSGINSFRTIQRGVKPSQKGVSIPSRRPVSGLYTEGDFFMVEPGQSIAVPGTLDSYVFRLVFSGQSFALRSFLNRIANSPLPIVVRGVEADLSSESGDKKDLETIAGNPLSNPGLGGRQGSDSAVPIISDNTSLFAVTLEFLELAVEIEQPRIVAIEKGAGDA